MVDVPSPVTDTASPMLAATILPPTTRMRCSVPLMKRSTITSEPSAAASGKAAATSSGVITLTNTPRAWLPSVGLTTTG